MKQLILIRHAKSSWEFNVIDHERPLNEKGINDAHLISNHLNKINPDKILCSDAKRTKQTADIFTANLKLSPNIFALNHKLYDFSGELLTDTIKACPDNINTLMVFGHNHAVTFFVNTYGSVFIDNVPTCGVIVINFEINSWSQLKKGITSKALFPKDLK